MALLSYFNLSENITKDNSIVRHSQPKLNANRRKNVASDLWHFTIRGVPSLFSVPLTIISCVAVSSVKSMKRVLYNDFLRMYH